MWEWFVALLHDSVVLRLFIVVGAGFLLGELRFPGNFRLGIAAVLFVGLAFGALDPEFVLPAEIQSIGLVLFVYCVGLEAGPGFVRSLRKDGLKLNLSVAASLFLAAAAVWLAIRYSGRPRETLVGLFCGALTNTPALGAATDWISRNVGDPQSANAAVVGYGVVYPFAVLGLLLFFHFRAIRAKPAELLSTEPTTLPQAQTIEVLTDNNGHPWSVAEVSARTGLVLTRLREPDGSMRIAADDLTLVPGTLLIAVGSPQNLQHGIALLGRLSAEPLEKNLVGFETHRYFVSNPEIAGRELQELRLENYGAVLSRLRRADVDLPVTDRTVLHLGDRVRVISYKHNEPAIRKLFGNSLTALTETGYVSFALGIALGLVLGAIPLPVPGLSEPVRLGIAGGPLVAALFLGFLGRTGPVIWNPPLPMTLTLRQLGILFFFACAGVKAGAVLPETIREDGLFLITLGIGVTFLSHLFLWSLLRVQRYDALGQSLGVSAGFQTQPALLTFAAQKTTPGPVNLAYATVYPLAIVLKVVLAQLLLIL